MNFKKYYELHKNDKPSDLLLQAISLVKSQDRTALDLGAAPFVSSIALRDAGFRVSAVDNDPSAKEYLPSDVVLCDLSFQDLELPYSGAYDLINAEYSLPFDPEMRDLLSKIYQSLKPGGVFTGTIFGDKDDWNKPGSGKVCISKDDFFNIFKDNIVFFDEVEKDGPTAQGIVKHWHVLKFIVQKRHPAPA